MGGSVNKQALFASAAVGTLAYAQTVNRLRTQAEKRRRKRRKKGGDRPPNP